MLVKLKIYTIRNFRPIEKKLPPSSEETAAQFRRNCRPVEKKLPPC
jgi:hypothetical protein